MSWTVRVWTDVGESNWAEHAFWEMGLLTPEDWVARWIEPFEPAETPLASPNAPCLFRYPFTLDRAVVRARLYVTAHGVYEFFVNGKRVGDAELTPGFTSYWSNLQVQTFDVTDLLLSGQNVMGAIVSDGWFCGQVNGHRFSNFYGERVALLAQLDVACSDGSLTRVGTGKGWVWGTGSIRHADLMQGQVIDLRREMVDWCMPDANVPQWLPTTVRDYDLARLCWSPAPPVRQVEEIRPVAVTRPHSGTHVFDIGQNINGWIRFGNLGPVGTTVTLTYGETLNADGDVTQQNLIQDPSARQVFSEPEFANKALPFQVDQVVSAGRSDASFEPRHTTHGFRYVRVEGCKDQLNVDDVAGVVVHSDMRRTGWFKCSDDKINQLHEAAVWSFRGNACDIPTDCPTRERSGWAGDWQLFVATAAFLYDVAGFSAKWLRDLAAEQQADGVIFDCAPNTLPKESLSKLGRAPGSAGWADAAVIVPWEIYRAYGDRDLLETQWPSMTAWVDYAARTARTARHPGRVAKRATQAPHDQFIWDTGFHWGEWQEPGSWEMEDVDSEMRALAASDHSDVASAYLHHSSRLLSKIAKAIGRDHDAAYYSNFASAVKAAWQTEFINPDATLVPDKQATYVRALAFDLVPYKLRPQLTERLVDLIRKADTHLGTGFLATPYLLPALAEAGQLDIAYKLLFQDTEPSWLTMIDRGATTTWEAWNGVDQDGVARLSLNHYSKGAVVSFLHRYIAGIRLLDDGPAYKRFRIAPMPGGGLTWTSAAHDSPYGRIESSWRINGNLFSLEVTVPPGTTAEVCLPDGRCVTAHPGRTHYDSLVATTSAPPS